MNVVALRSETGSIALSAIVPVTGRFDDAELVYRAYSSALQATGHAFEMIYVFDAPAAPLAFELRALQGRGEPISVIELTQSFGEAVCLNVGVQRARGELILILPPYLQVVPEALPAMVAALEHADLVAASRDRRDDHWLNRLRHRGLQGLASLSGSRIPDLGCLVRACRRRVLDEVTLDDEHHRFLPLFAQQAGFVVEDVIVPQAPSDRRFRLHRPAVYLGRMLDILAVAFLLRFMQRPFRFFGTLGCVLAALGASLGATLVVEKLLYGAPLADRPALLLAALLVVLGIQIGAVGLIAEIIIFTRSGRMSTFRVERIVEHASGSSPEGQASVSPPSR